MARSLKKGPFVDPSLQRKVDRMATRCDIKADRYELGLDVQ